MRAYMGRSAVRVGLSFIAGTLVASAMIGPGVAAGGHPITKAAVQSRVSSCAGLQFHPMTSNTFYGYVGDMLFQSVPTGHNTTSKDGFFICDPKLPQSARVTKVQFTVYDNFNGDEVRFCGLFRTPLGGTVDSYQTLAQVPRTGINNTPGRTRKTASSISYATINNAKYAYWLQCQITAEESTDEFTGLYGADVYYSIDPANG